MLYCPSLAEIAPPPFKLFPIRTLFINIVLQLYWLYSTEMHEDGQELYAALLY
jgi:hypothetical protein